ncbi:MAG TPA: LuxR C-terminal-related transcriptional regulator [Acidimicrobiales bacterium]|nr:LuxR C-terminal-related transcriptional regulator [Acidimicrobiales bacterium]
MASGETIVARAKFRVPRVPNATVRREALVGRLGAAADRPLSLVVGAPGSGKTALLAQWVDQLDGPVGWMSCDLTDADGNCFWNNLATTVGMAWPDVGTTAAELADGNRSAELAIGLANELGAVTQPGVIVIDDFHLARPDPGVMRAFIGALPPHVRVVLGSRSDPPFPVGKLRLQGRMLELRQAELRFTSAEARELLAALGVEVSDRELEQIIAITEGWTAAVHLAGLWLRGHGDPAGLLRGLAETDRSLVDFLMNEVIALQPPEMVEFLTVTAELEMFDAGLCDAVCAGHDSNDMLRRADAASLFLVELDRAAGWYRYHHLFAQFLRGRLRAVAPERAPSIHLAAADAYAKRGDLMSAVHHSMKAGDTDGSLTQLRNYATGTWSLEDQMTGGATARAWLQEHGASQLERSPQSILACTIVLNAIGHGDAAEPWLQQVEARERDLDRESHLLLHAAWSFDCLQRGDPAAALDRARRAEALLQDGPVDSEWVEALPNLVVQGHLWLDDLDAAEAALDAVRADPVRPPVLCRVRVPGFGSHIQARRGELTEAERLAAAALTAADELELHHGNFGRAEPHLSLAIVAIERNELDLAETHLEDVMRIVEGGRRPSVEVLAHLQLAVVAGARGDQRAAADAIDQARAVFPHAASAVIAQIDQVDLRLAVDRGDHATAETLRAHVPPSPGADLLAARARLAADDRRAALDILESTAAPSGTRRLQVEHGLLSALALTDTDVRRAREALHGAVTLAQPVGFHRTFIAEGPTLWKLLESLPAHGRIAEYIADLLDASNRVVPSPAPANQDGLVDPLSDREVTVLRYLASRLTCTEISQELYLSVNTVRSHVKAVYRKLGVNSRRDAVGRGRGLGLT